MTDLEKRLLVIQQKIKYLTEEVADLVALTSDSTQRTSSAHLDEAKVLAKRPFTDTLTNQVGLNRFRQLAEEAA